MVAQLDSVSRSLDLASVSQVFVARSQQVHHVFDQMLHQDSNLDRSDNGQGEISVDVVWDEDTKDAQSMLDQDSLLKQLAVDRDHFVGEDWVSAKGKQVPVQASAVVWDRQEGCDELSGADVVDRIRKNQQIIAQHLEATKEALMQFTLSQRSVHKVSHTGHEQLLSSTPVGTRHATQEPFKVSRSSVASERAALQVFREMHYETVWDDESIHSIDSHDGLLQQLAQGDAYLDAEFSQSELHTFEEAMFVEHVVPVHQPKVTSMTSLSSVEAGCSVFEERPHVDVLWDEEMQFDTDMHDGLLQQLASRHEYVDNKKLIVKFEHMVDDVARDAEGSVQYFGVDTDTTKAAHGVFSEQDIAMPPMESGLDARHLKWEEMVGTMVGHSVLSLKLGAADRPQVIYDMPSDFAIHEDLSSEMECSGALLHGQPYCVNIGEADKKIKPTIELTDDSLLMYVGGLSLSLVQSMKFNVSVHTYSLSYAKCQLPTPWKTAFSVRRQWDRGKGKHKHARWSTNRQWDPGIGQFIMQELAGENKCFTKSYLGTECYEVVSKVFLDTATAWGQAVFRGGGNVMTHTWPRRSPSDIRSIDPSQSLSAAQELTIYSKVSSTGKTSNKFRIRNQRGTGKGIFLLRLSRSYPPISLQLLTLPVRSRRCSHGCYRFICLYAHLANC